LKKVWAKPTQRNQILEQLQSNEVGTAFNYRAIHLLKFYSKTFDYKEGTFPNAERVNSTILIPLYPKLTDKEFDYLIKHLIQTV